MGHRRKLQKEIANARRLAGDPVYITPPCNQPSQQQSGQSAYQADKPQQRAPIKRGYRHHPKPDLDTPHGPYSAYMMFSNGVREQVEYESLSCTEISRQVGLSWQSLTGQQKGYWKGKAAVRWEKYRSEVAEYQPRQNPRSSLKQVCQTPRPTHARPQSQQQQQPLNDIFGDQDLSHDGVSATLAPSALDTSSHPDVIKYSLATSTASRSEAASV
jgi:hypothetical protein